MKKNQQEYWEEIARAVLGEPRESGALEAKWGKHFKEELAIDSVKCCRLHIMRIENAPSKLAMWRSWVTSLWKVRDEIRIKRSPRKTRRRESIDGKYRQLLEWVLLWKEQRNGVASGGWWEVCFILPWHVIAICLFASGKMIVERETLIESKREKTIAYRRLCAASFWGLRFFFISRKGQLFCL